jgi:transposase
LPLIRPPIKRKTLINIINRYKRTNHIIQQPRTGRKRKLTEEVVREICRNQDETNSITLLDHVEKINLNHPINIHKSSIHSALKKQKYSTKSM